MKRFSSLENQHRPRLPLFSRARAALVTVPPAAGPPDGNPGACATTWGWQPSPGSPQFSLCEKPAILPPSSGLEYQSETLSGQASMEATPGGVSFLRMSAQSKWLKYQNSPQCALLTPSQPKASVTDGFPATAMGMCFGDAGERCSNTGDSSAGPTPLQRVRGKLRQQQWQVDGTRDFVCRRKALSLRLESASKAEDVCDVWEESACAIGLQVRTCPSAPIRYCLNFNRERIYSCS